MMLDGEEGRVAGTVPNRISMLSCLGAGASGRCELEHNAVLTHGRAFLFVFLVYQ